MIYINGDRIGVNELEIGIENKDFDFLIPFNDYDGYSDIKKLNDIGLKCDGEIVDIGHGYNNIVLGIILNPDLHKIIKGVIEVGVTIQQLKTMWEGYNFIINKFKEHFNKEEDCYHSEKMLITKFNAEVYERYKEKAIESMQIISTQKTPFGSKGLYAVKNENYDKTSLAGTPEFILSIVAKVRSFEGNKDYDLIRAELLSNGKITRFVKDEISCTDGIGQLI